ncbi:Chemoreceptor glutamine deamidase CheD [uncultured archaeon]|nr:Chemoreceptor glutamine deamidase CheD [uncultured archaeon]
MDLVKEKIIIGIADLAVVHNPAVLVTIGLGSCVAISFRDPVAKFGGLAHILLPSIEESRNKDNPLKFADTAIEKAVEMMLLKGCVKNRIETKIAGGASMFSFKEADMQIGARNVEAVRGKLGEMKLPIIASDTGGNYGRTIEFDIASGVMLVKSAFNGNKAI